MRITAGSPAFVFQSPPTVSQGCFSASVATYILATNGLDQGSDQTSQIRRAGSDESDQGVASGVGADVSDQGPDRIRESDGLSRIR